MKNVLYYAKGFGYNALPTAFFKWNYKRLRALEQDFEAAELERRLHYYLHLSRPFEVPDAAVAVKDFRRSKGTGYYLDLKEFLHYFSPETRFAYYFGDDTHVNSYPTLFKAREIGKHSAHSVLFKLNKRRHFKWVDDALSFSKKKDKMVWRGAAYRQLRRDFIQKCWNHPKCNAGQTNRPPENVPWQKGFLSIEEQLNYKFILCLEGNDVATSLKWVLSSNSLCFMPKPKYETWFMEGTLQKGVHYVELNGDYSDLDEKIDYYSSNIEEAEWIIENANQHVALFQNKDLEDLLCLKVLERYANLSGQEDYLKFM